MTSKRKRPAQKRDPRLITASGTDSEDPALVLARTVLRPAVQAAATLGEYNKSWYEPDLTGHIDTLATQTEAVNNGDLSGAESMLAVQAHTLDTIFNNLSRRAINAEYLNNLECYLKLALRAQFQCRGTWEALATIKNPPLAGYVKQANIAHGPQQVNIDTTSNAKTLRARENQNLQNELLEKKDGERLDFGTTSAASKADPRMATVGTGYRTKNNDR